MSAAPELELQTRSQRKRAAIVAAATGLFLEKGYLGTSMDEIATMAAVSKQTVYKHFADKERLFSEIVTTTVNEPADRVHAEVDGLAESTNIERDLRELARRQLRLVMQPRVLKLRRLVIAEASRFPELGRAFYERGPARTIAALTGAFEQLAARGLLALDDAQLAAAHFNWLVMSIPLNEAMLLGEDTTPNATDLHRYADAGVRAFLAAYGTGRFQNHAGVRRPPSDEAVRSRP
ncbi:MAG: TetR/AcrR family transcriptional regulator [Solirubrobacteraceae bacterium]